MFSWSTGFGPISADVTPHGHSVPSSHTVALLSRCCRQCGGHWAPPPQSPLDVFMESSETTNPLILGVSPLEKLWSGTAFCCVAWPHLGPCRAGTRPILSFSQLHRVCVLLCLFESSNPQAVICRGKGIPVTERNFQELSVPRERHRV